MSTGFRLALEVGAADLSIELSQNFRVCALAPMPRRYHFAGNASRDGRQDK